MSSRTNEIILKAISLAEPTAAQAKRGDQIASQLLSKVRRLARTHHLHPKVVLGGSFAKGTWLSETLEIDIFLLFPREITANELESEGLLLAKQSLLGDRPTLRYAQHPYVEAFIQDFRINLVPCFETKLGEWKSAADRSPFHTKYMNNHLSQKLRKEVRLLKLFMKRVGIYGSEIKVQGFSGYACEVLILKYRTFLSTLANVSRWKEREVVCIEPSVPAMADQVKEQLIILDPIDHNRNLGMAISPQKIGQFVLSSRSFLSSPGMMFFRSDRKRSSKLEQDLLRQSAIGILLSHSSRIPDVLWGQLKKSGHHIRERMLNEGFEVARAIIASDEKGRSALLYLLVNQALSSLVVKEGPEYFRIQESRKFIEKNSRRGSIAWIGGTGRLKALKIRNQDLGLKSFLEELISSKTSGISLGLREEIKNSEILMGEQLLTAGRRKRWLSEGLQDLVSTEEL